MTQVSLLQSGDVWKSLSTFGMQYAVKQIT